MTKETFKRLGKFVDAIDLWLAGCGSLAGVFLIIWSTLTPAPYRGTGIIILLTSCAYLLAVRRASFEDIAVSPVFQLSTAMITFINLLYFALFCFSLISVACRPEIYARPMGYFVAVSLCAGLIGLEILFLPRGRIFTYCALLKILLLVLNLTWIPHLLAAGLIGMDPWGHFEFTTLIASTGHIPEGYPYTHLPVMHLGISSVMLLTSFGYKLSAMIFFTFCQLTGLVFLYLLGGFIHSDKTGLMAALVLGICDGFLRQGIVIIAMGLAMCLWPVILYLVFKSLEMRSRTFKIIVIIFLVTLILTHTVAAFGMALLFLIFWLGFQIYNRTGNSVIITVSLSLTCFFWVGLLGWWMYVSGHIEELSKLIEWGFSETYWPARRSIAGVVNYLSAVPAREILLNKLGYAIFTFFSVSGCLYFLSKKGRNSFAFVIVTGAGVLFSMGYFTRVTGVLLPERWCFFAQILESIPCAVGILAFCASLRFFPARLTAVLLTVATLTFFMITNPTVNYDSPVYARNTTVRYFLTGNELASLNTIIANWQHADRAVGIDATLEYYIRHNAHLPVVLITKELGDGDFSNLRGRSVLIIIREELLKRPFFGYTGPFKIGYDPEVVLRKQGFNRVYTSGAVSAYLKLEN